jgi:hypothetical protein
MSIGRELDQMPNSVPPTDFDEFRVQWRSSGNPVWVWHAVAICRDQKLDLPRWILDYLGECAERMLSKGAMRERDIRRVLPDIFGFVKSSGPGRLLRANADMLKDEAIAMVFAESIFLGARPVIARANAAEKLCKDDELPDDRTLQRVVRTFFQVDKAPHDNDGWRKIITSWLVAHPWYEVSYPRLPKLLDLMFSSDTAGIVRVDKDGRWRVQPGSGEGERITPQEVALAKQAASTCVDPLRQEILARISHRYRNHRDET